MIDRKEQPDEPDFIDDWLVSGEPDALAPAVGLIRAAILTAIILVALGALACYLIR